MKALNKGIFLLFAFMLVSSAFVWAAGQGEMEEAGADYPSKPIQFIVPANPGGGTDLGARLLAKYLADEIGTNIIITNMPGAGGTVASSYVADAEPDGYTLLYQHESFVANRVFGLSDLDLQTMATASGTFEVDTVCLFSKDIESWDELVRIAEREEVVLGTEVGTAFHILFEAIKDRSGLENLKFVDTGAVSPTLAALEGDQIDIALVPLGVIRDSVESGRYNVLALTSARERSQFVPDVPTMTELGINVYLPKFFFQAFPPGTPESIVSTFREAVQRMMENPDFIEEGEALLYKTAYISPEELYDMEEAAYDLMTTYAPLIME
jgi:tripartite-type tricarboxylate transporter receptor subunit TctC